MPNYGISIDGITDSAKTWALASDIKNLGNAIGRRLTTETGSLFYDLGYGYDIRNLLGAPITDEVRQNAARKIEEQCTQDERISQATATIERTDEQSIKITVKGRLSDATSFTFILGINQLTVSLLTAENI